MVKLTKMQIATVKRMAKTMNPIERKMDRLHKRKEEIEEELASLDQQLHNVHSAIETFTGGLSLVEILNPEATPTAEMNEDAVADGEAEAEEIEVTNVFNDAVVAPTEQETVYPSIDEL